ncbi:hypothetical protein FSP39_004269 [Pinctada imbricata]|uniref:Uncharacterized protein n=1 Tax=Pinctada imbricata TaxID=66713 RepID=A0AA88XKI1_PINIB|nr:hypothetical protein FSP39_004269 [Pinctada imbricata]
MRILRLLAIVFIGLSLVIENDAFSRRFLRKLRRQGRMNKNSSKKMMMAGSQSAEMSGEENMLGSEFEWDEMPKLANWRKYFRWLIKQRLTTTSLPIVTSSSTAAPVASTKSTSDKVSSTMMPVTQDPTIVVSTESGSSTPKVQPSTTLLPLPVSSQNPSITTDLQTTQGPYPTATATSKPFSTTKDTRIDAAGNPIGTDTEGEGAKTDGRTSVKPIIIEGIDTGIMTDDSVTYPSAFTTEPVPIVPILPKGDSSTSKPTPSPDDKILISLSNSEVNTENSLVYPAKSVVVDVAGEKLGNGNQKTVNMENGEEDAESNGEHSNNAADNGGHSNVAADNGGHSNVAADSNGHSDKAADNNGGHSNVAADNGGHSNVAADNGGHSNVAADNNGGHSETSANGKAASKSTFAQKESNMVNGAVESSLVPQVKSNKGPETTVFFTTPLSPKASSFTFQVVSTGAPTISKSSSSSSSSSSVTAVDNGDGYVVIPAVSETKGMSSSSSSSSSSSTSSSSSSSTQVINNQSGWVIIPPLGDTFMEVPPTPASNQQNPSNTDQSQTNGM